MGRVGRLCERPGCARPADAAYTIDVGRLIVTLGRLDQLPRATSVVCAVHAATLTVPRHWTLDDQRVSAPPLFRLPPAAAPERARPVRRHPSAGLPLAGTEQLRLVVDRDEPEEPVAPEPAERDATTVLAWRPRFDTGDDLDGLLDASSPLLARAFQRPHRPG